MYTVSSIIILNTTMLLLNATVTSIQSYILFKEMSKNVKS